jgi:ATP-dependent DNA ligase
VTDWPFRPPLAPMEARVRETLPEGSEWAYEPKWDGFRVLAWGGDVRLDSRNKRPLLRYFPELEEPLRRLPEGTVVDGEVVVVTEDRLDFDALSQRIHPAESRIRLLAQETPAELIAFDMLASEGVDLISQPYQRRRAALESLASGWANDPVWHLTPMTTELGVARRWFDEFEAAGCDGIVAKRLSDQYKPGERQMVKVKNRHTVDVVVGGYRLHKDGDKIGALLLGLYDEAGELHFVGHCASFSEADRTAMLAQFRELETDASFGEHARRPEQEHRWAGQRMTDGVPVDPIVVMEVSHDQITNWRFRHASRFLRWRPDKDATECGLDQLRRPGGAGLSAVLASPSVGNAPGVKGRVQ